MHLKINKRESRVSFHLAIAIAGVVPRCDPRHRSAVAKRVKGIDLRTVGSGLLGATNLYRILGW